MQRFLSGAIAILIGILGFALPAAAADLAHGSQIFSANCASCHLGGRNVVNAAKTLQQADLEKYGLDSLEAIAAQITNGKAAMPAFSSKLSADDITDVASYVFDQAEKGWKA